MLEEITAAFNSEDYTTAEKLVNQLQKEDEDNPWLPIYHGRLAQAKGNLVEAAEIYRQVLCNTTNIKIVSAARMALGELQAKVEQQRQAELRQSQIRQTQLQQEELRQAQLRQAQLAEVKAQSNGDDLAVLVFTPIAPEKKQQAAQQLAKIMQMDTYSARMLLPSKTFRLYRTGNLGEVRYYAQLLNDAGIPSFAISTANIEQIQVYQISYFESMIPDVTLMAVSPEGEELKMTFEWSEVAQWAQGALPIFEQTTDNHKGKIQKKTETLDYSHICDLHLAQKNLILRLSDHYYEFQQGMTFLVKQSTARSKWNAILKLLETTLPEVPLWSDFTTFAEKAIDSPDLLKRLTTHIHLFRREESLWDAAFHLYSSLVFFTEKPNF